MRCEAVHEAISAQLDGEPTMPAALVETHLDECADCRTWRELAHVVTRRTRLGGPLPSPDLGAVVLAAVLTDARRRRTRRHWLAVARAVVGVGLLQLLATVPLLAMARDRTSGGGRVHVLGLVELAIGAGFFLGALAVLWRERGQAPIAVAGRDGRDESARRDAADGVSEVA